MRHIAATLAVVGALLFSAGSALAEFDDDTASANELFVEAVKLVKSVENTEGSIEKAEVLEEALSKLNEIVDDYPSSDLAVKLISGQDTGSVSLEVVGKELDRSIDEAERAATRARKEAERAAEQARKEAERERKEAEERAKFEENLKLAERGHAAEQSNLGIMYFNGKGVPKDYVKAAKWYLKAAEQGYAWAQYKLGVMYANGRGVPQNDAEAIKWFRMAADQGHRVDDVNEWLERLEAK